MTSFYSTKKIIKNASFEEAVLQGLALDGGLFMPRPITPLSPSFFDHIHTLSFSEIAFEVAKHLLQDTIPLDDLKKIVERSINFDAPLIRLSDEVYVLELFHGPTLSFKDFGAHFMAHMMIYLMQQQECVLHILVATSGDTGSAVAHGFLDAPGIKVWILYPKGQVSEIQEQQLTTVGHNVTALEIEGTFDDCQALVKKAFNDKELCQSMKLTSANSINIARLIPQTFYYFYAYAQLKKTAPILFSVPSGNFGNLTAGLIAKKMGLPVERFIAATNVNDSVPQYLQTGVFNPHPSIRTLSNAMDVGNPSNFARIIDLYNGNLNDIRKDIFGISFTNSQTQEAMRETDKKYQYLSEPHGAIAYYGLTTYQRQVGFIPGIFLETAHPAKFRDIVEPLVRKKILMPKMLRKALETKKQVNRLSNEYNDLKHFLLNSIY